MSDTIFEQTKAVKATDNLMSFEGCPNGCRDGFYVDPYKHKRVRCEYCYELRKKLAKSAVAVEGGASIAKVLRLESSFMGYGNFDADSLWPSARINRLEVGSVSFVRFVLQRLIEQVSVGEPVKSSILLNFGGNAHSQNFISPFLVRSYISGILTAPRLTSRDLINLRSKEAGTLQSGLLSVYEDLWYNDMIKADTCLVYIDSAAGEQGFMAAKGLMQLRSWEGKGTIILTDYYSHTMYELCEERDELKREYIARNTETQNRDMGNKIVDGTMSSSRDLALLVSVFEKTAPDVKKTSPTQGGSSQQTSLLRPVDSVGLD